MTSGLPWRGVDADGEPADPGGRVPLSARRTPTHARSAGVHRARPRREARMRGAAVAVVGAVALMLGGTVMVAWAVVGRGTLDPTGTGNSLPIDDNHRSLRPTPAAPGDSLGTAALHDDRQDDGRPVPGVVPGGTD